MFAILDSWLERRRAIRRRWQADARRLVREDERGAYYQAQRLAARARAEGRSGEFAHWAKVAAEVARLSPRADMELALVQAIVDEELRRRARTIRRGCGVCALARRFVRETACTTGKQSNPALLRCLLVQFRISVDQPAAGSAT